MIRGREDLRKVKRLVIKVGSSLLTDSAHGIDTGMVNYLASLIASLQQQGMQVCLVSSGAVAAGRVHLGWLGRKLSVHEKQAAAAVGQPSLMHAYKEAFAQHGLQVAQMLLTKDDLRHRRRYLNASNTSETLFAAGVVPIVNENDTVVVEEIKFGDNDALGALVSLVIDADLMVMMTDVSGLYDKNPATHADASRLGLVDGITPEVMEMAGDAGSDFGTGGMVSKLKAARISTTGGVTAVIVSGREREALSALLAGEDVGTVFRCGEDRQTRRQHWIAEVLHVAGMITVDAGAMQALQRHGGSLLPIGVVRVDGRFDKGECVELYGPDGLIGRGLVNYNADELSRIAGVQSEQIENVLGYVDFTSVVHRDNLVLMERGGS